MNEWSLPQAIQEGVFPEFEIDVIWIPANFAGSLKWLKQAGKKLEIFS
jgi:hypothetical protein